MRNNNVRISLIAAAWILAAGPAFAQAQPPTVQAPPPTQGQPQTGDDGQLVVDVTGGRQ